MDTSLGVIIGRPKRRNAPPTSKKKPKKTESNIYLWAQGRRKHPRLGRTKRRNAPQIKSQKRNKNIYL